MHKVWFVCVREYLLDKGNQEERKKGKKEMGFSAIFGTWRWQLLRHIDIFMYNIK